METLVLTVADIRKVIASIGLDQLMDDTIEGLEEMCRQFAGGGSEAPARSGFFYSHPAPGLLEWMPARDASGRATLKIVGYHPENPEQRRLPTILSTIAEFETQTGHLTALLDGTLITAVRTGAASAVASRILAKPQSRTLGMIGCGAQAITQLHALSRCFPLERVVLFDPDRQTAEQFAQRMARVELDSLCYEIVEHPQQAVAEADILSTCTLVEPGEGPVFEDRSLRPWVHVNAVGSDVVGKTELPLSVLDRGFVCADFPDQCLHEGECQQLTREQIDVSLPDLVASPGMGHAARDALTVFDSTGWSLSDHVTSGIVIREALRLGLGQHLAIEATSPRDPKNPYEFLDDEGVHSDIAHAPVGRQAKAGS